MTKKLPVDNNRGKNSGSPDEVHDEGCGSVNEDRGGEKMVDEGRVGAHYYDDDDDDRGGGGDGGTTYGGMI